MGQPVGAGAKMKYITAINDHAYAVELVDEHHVSIDGTRYEMRFSQVGDQPVYSLLLDGKSYEGMIYLDEEHWQVILHGALYAAKVEDEREQRLRAHLKEGKTVSGEFHLKAPMPGMVVSVPVTEGQAVEKGEVLLILESMKMQNELRSPKAGTVIRLKVNPGDRVEKKQTLLSVL
jgi:biotin carboxyl carrier protein